MLQLHFHVFVALAICTVAVTSAMRIPLHVNEEHAAANNFRLRDANGDATNVVDIAAVRREIAKVQRRYGGETAEEDSDLEKRWINTKNFVHDKAFMDDEDNMIKNLMGSVHEIGGKISQTFKNGVTSPQSMNSEHSGSQKLSQPKSDSPFGSLFGSAFGSSDGSSDTVSQTNQNQASGSGSSKSGGASGSSAAAGKDQSTSGENGNMSAASSLKAKLTDGSEFEYVSDIAIGTPPQAFKINPDTGSADTWVMSDACTGKNCGSDGRSKFASKKSSSYSEMDKKFDLQYGIGDVSGKFARDTVKIGDLTAQKQTLGFASKVSSDWKRDAGSGVMGLGFRSITSAGQRTLLQNIAVQNKLKKSVVSFAFGRQKSGTAGKSQMLIGDIDSRLFRGDLKYYKLSKPSYWQTGFKSFATKGGKGVNNNDAIFDTGTSLIAGNEDVVSEFWEGVKGSKVSEDGTYYTYPCDAKINAQLIMPDGTVFPIDESDINLGQESTGSDRCIGTVLISQTPGPIIMGLSMLKNMYQVYDFTTGKERIGLAPYNF